MAEVHSLRQHVAREEQDAVWGTRRIAVSSPGPRITPGVSAAPASARKRETMRFSPNPRSRPPSSLASPMTPILPRAALLANRPLASAPQKDRQARRWKDHLSPFRRSSGKAEPITVAVAGLGRAGWDIHVRAIRGRKDFVLTEVMDLAPERAGGGAGGVRVPDLQGLEDVPERLRGGAGGGRDAVARPRAGCPCRPWRLGKHVLVEKPMATKVADLDKMIAAAKKSKKLLTVHQSARLHADYLRIQEVDPPRRAGTDLRDQARRVRLRAAQ